MSEWRESYEKKKSYIIIGYGFGYNRGNKCNGDDWRR